MNCLIHIISENRWGGVARYAFDIGAHCKGIGWEVMALTRDCKAVDNHFEQAGIKLVHAPLRGITDLGSAVTLSRVFKDMPQVRIVVHAHSFANSFTALLARKLSGRNDIRVIMTRHKVKRGRDTWLYRRIYRNLDAMVFVSKLARDRFLSTWRNRELPFPGNRVHVINNSLNEELPVPCERDAKGPAVAMFHGVIAPGKGIETIVDALSLLKGARIRLRIVGSGEPDYIDRLRRRAMTRNVMDMIDWHKHTDDPMPLIRDCDFGVLPSVAEEAFGMANIEYMACGRAQVCTSNGAQPEYLTDGREAFLVPPGNTAQLAESMRKLAADRELRCRMGERAYETYKGNLCWQKFTESFEPLLFL